jgi:hypothetical protein
MGGSGTKSDAFANSGTALNQSNQLGANAGALYGPLSAQLQSQMAHPSGYTPAQMAAQNTAAQQSAGGSNASTVGQGALLAARTRNAGAAQNAIAQGGRQASQNLSNAAVGTQVRNANLQQQNQRAATSGLENLYGTELGGSQNALGLSNSAIKIAGEQAPSFWQQMGYAAGKPIASGLGGAISGSLFG